MHTSYSQFKSAKPAQASSEAMGKQSMKSFSAGMNKACTKMLYFGSSASGASSVGAVKEGFSMKTIVSAFLEIGMFAGVILGWLQFALLLMFGGVMVFTGFVILKALI